jgi:hypothetical protein
LDLKQKILVRRKHLEALFNAADTLFMIMKGRMIDEDLAVGNLPALSLKGLRTQRRLRREMKQLQRIIEDLRADRQRYLGSKSKSVWMELEEEPPTQRKPPKKTKKQQNVNRNLTMKHN